MMERAGEECDDEAIKDEEAFINGKEFLNCSVLLNVPSSTSNLAWRMSCVYRLSLKR